jgi:uncharacterized protein YnzC (UPF0291/DUF896 family)
MNDKILRINELARKKRLEGLTDAESLEQQRLRMEYLHDFRDGMERMLENIVVEQPDGAREPLRKRSSK